MKHNIYFMLILVRSIFQHELEKSANLIKLRIPGDVALAPVCDAVVRATSCFCEMNSSPRALAYVLVHDAVGYQMTFLTRYILSFFELLLECK